MQSYKWTYPLDWPLSQKRTKEPVRSRFGRMGQSSHGSWITKKPITISQAVQTLLEELGRMNCHSVSISSDLVLKQNGEPRSAQKEPDDKGVAAVFIRGKKTFIIAIDRYNKIADNIKAIARTVSAYRQIERDGGPEILESAMYGFTKGLPAPGETTNGVGRDPWEIMGLKQGTFDAQDLKTRWRALSKKYHADNSETGDSQEFSLVQWAYKQLSQQVD